MKATYRNGKGSADHNDRNYLSATEADKEEIISKWQLFKECDSFRDNEIKAYEQLYGEWLKNRNEKLIKEGHSERCKTVEDLVGKPNEEKRKGRYEVNETILQIGKDGEEVDDDTLRACVNHFMSETRRRYGEHMEWLDVAVHRENSSVVHAHLRRTWFAYDEEGRAYPAKKEALKALGFEVRADDDKYNNATTRHSEAERELWYETCKEFGIDIDTEPDQTNTKHLSIKDYKYKKDQETKEAIKQIDTEAKQELETERAKINDNMFKELDKIGKKADKRIADAQTFANNMVESKLKKMGLTTELATIRDGSKQRYDKMTDDEERE